MYNSISDYVLNPTALKIVAGMLAVGGVAFFGASIKVYRNIRRMGERETSQLINKIEEND